MVTWVCLETTVFTYHFYQCSPSNGHSMGIPPASVARQLFHPSGQDDELRVQSLHAGILRAGHVAMVGGMVMYGLYVLLLSLVCWCHYHHDQKDLNCESNHITSLTFFSSTQVFTQHLAYRGWTNSRSSWGWSLSWSWWTQLWWLWWANVLVTRLVPVHFRVPNLVKQHI